MPEPDVLLRNRRAQPVELHLPGGVRVLAPLGQARVGRSLLATPQVAWLLARKLIDVAPATTGAPPAAAPKVPKATAKAADPAAAPGAARTDRGDRRATKP